MAVSNPYNAKRELFMKISALISLVASCTLLLTACDSQPTVQTTPQPVSMANPASSYCIEQGGTLEIETQANGQVGYCTLPNGQRIEEWQLYRQSQQTDESVVQRKPAFVGKANPASEYCISLQGQLDLASGICTLPSGEAIEQWQLFEHGHKQAPDVTEMQKAPNPAAQYCLEIGGKVDLADGSCTLPNGEKVDQWTLFNKHKLMSI